MGVVGQGGVRREVDEKDRRRTKGYEVVVDRGRGETGVGQKVYTMEVWRVEPQMQLVGVQKQTWQW